MFSAIRLILLALVVSTLPGQASAADKSIAKLKAVSGQVWLIVPPSKQEVPATAPHSLLAGTRIRTGAESRAELVFPDGASGVCKTKLRSQGCALLAESASES